MKKTAGFIFILGLLAVACNTNEESTITTDVVNNTETASGKSNDQLPVIEFEKVLYDFGTITQGEKVSYSYKFKNTGKADLIIASAKGSCGCTVPDWPKKPIPPGGEAKIKVVFSSEGKSGKQHKKVTIVANTQPSTSVVAISGEIIAPDK